MPSQNVDQLVCQKLINSQAKIHAVCPSVYISHLAHWSPDDASRLGFIRWRWILSVWWTPLSQITAVQHASQISCSYMAGGSPLSMLATSTPSNILLICLYDLLCAALLCVSDLLLFLTIWWCLQPLINILMTWWIFCISGECYQHDDSDSPRESYGAQCAKQLFYSATDVTEWFWNASAR